MNKTYGQKKDKTGSKPFIGSIDSAPTWQVFNIDIKSGYRINYGTNWLAFKSLFQFHNETCNVWSHLLGALLCIAMGFYVQSKMQPSSPFLRSSDVCPAAFNQCTVDEYFRFGEMMHSNPTFFHSFYNHHVEAFERKVDLILISNTAVKQ